MSRFTHCGIPRARHRTLASIMIAQFGVGDGVRWRSRMVATGAWKAAGRTLTKGLGSRCMIELDSYATRLEAVFHKQGSAEERQVQPVRVMSFIADGDCLGEEIEDSIPPASCAQGQLTDIAVGLADN